MYTKGTATPCVYAHCYLLHNLQHVVPSCMVPKEVTTKLQISPCEERYTVSVETHMDEETTHTVKDPVKTSLHIILHKESSHMGGGHMYSTV